MSPLGEASGEFRLLARLECGDPGLHQPRGLDDHLKSSQSRAVPAEPLDKRGAIGQALGVFPDRGRADVQIEKHEGAVVLLVGQDGPQGVGR